MTDLLAKVIEAFDFQVSTEGVSFSELATQISRRSFSFCHPRESGDPEEGER
jgi:hypothetical protein